MAQNLNIKNSLYEAGKQYQFSSLWDVDSIAKANSNAIDNAMRNLDPKIQDNFASLSQKFPNQSKDYLLGAAKMGLNANSKGIEKLAAADGIAQLKQDLANVNKISSTADNNKNVADWLYSALKGSIRYTFAATALPKEVITTVARDLYSGQADNIAGNVGFFGLNSNTTTIGQILKGKGTGSGFFVGHDTQAGKAQAKAMSAYGRINGESFTLGRLAINGLGVHPESTPYRVMSGVIDAVNALALDPLTWVGPGSVSRLLRSRGEDYRTVGTLLTGGLAKKKTGRKGAIAAAGRVLSAEEETLIKESKILTRQESRAQKAITKEEKSIKRKAENTYLAEERKLQKTTLTAAYAQERRFGRLLTLGIKSSDAIAGDAQIAAVLDKGQVTRFVTDTIYDGGQEEIVNRLGQLSADYDNTRGVFIGIYFDEVPTPGQLSIGAQADQEFVAGVSQALNILDINQTFGVGGLAARAVEVERRTELFTALGKAAADKKIPEDTRAALTEFLQVAGKTEQELVDTMVFGNAAESLASIIARASQIEDENVALILIESIKDIWKVDGFSNIRAVHGGVGGVVITDGAKVGARRVSLTDVLLDNPMPQIKPSTLARIEADIARDRAYVDELTQSVKEAKKAAKNTERNLKELEILRDYASQDPDLIASIVSDPRNIGIQKYVGMNLDIAENQYRKEFLRQEVGMINGFGGELATDLKKAASYILGKRFNQIAQIVAREKDFARLHALFGRKLDVEMTKELVDATTTEQVLSIFLRHLASPENDPQVYRSLTLNAQALELAKNKPLFKMVLPMDKTFNAIKAIEKIDKFWSKQIGTPFVRHTVLPLDNLDRLIYGFENWMVSAKIPRNVIDDAIRGLAKTSNNEERSRVAFDIVDKTHVAISKQIAPKDIRLQEELKEVFRIQGFENNIIKAYYPERFAKGELPKLALVDGKIIDFGGDNAMFEFQFLDDVIKLPDTSEIKRVISKYKNNRALYGSKYAINVFSEQFGDRWRTGQLAFRGAYVLRNIGEMQFRQLFSGHDSLFNHPFSYIAMIAADPNGNTWSKFLAKTAKYQNDALGNRFITKDSDVQEALSEAVGAHLDMLNRQIYSSDVRYGFVGKMYEVITTADDAYYKGLAETLVRFGSDRFVQTVANALDPNSWDQIVDDIINQRKGYEGMIESLVSGGRQGLDGNKFANILLKDAKQVNGKYNISPENIIAGNLKNYMFDLESSSVLRAINNMSGTGESAASIRSLLGGNTVEIAGKRIKIPAYKGLKNVADMADEDRAFKSILSRTFSRDSLVDSQVIFARDKKVLAQNTKGLDAGVDFFFKFATKLENVVNFGPEYRMAYWDFVGRYVPTLSDKALRELAPEARKSLRGLTIGGRFPVGKRQHPVLRAIDKEIKDRAAGKTAKGNMTVKTINSMASKKASEYTKNLFYDAAKQSQAANALRLLFPFAQAQFNTLNVWSKLFLDNPVEFYKVGRAFNALTQPGTSAIYDLTGVKYDENQGFFYTDEFGVKRFRYPLAGSVIGAIAGKSLSAGEALQLSAPIEALNVAWGQVNPALPGFGPTAQVFYKLSGKSGAFGPGYDVIRKVIFPFGEPKNIEDYIAPAWLKKSFFALVGNDSATEKNVKDWASYLASTGDYGDDPLSDQAARNEMFNDARSMAKWSGILGGFFQSIAPATPAQEIFSKDKDGMLRTQTLMYNEWDQIVQKYPGNYWAAVGEFADTFGIKNVLNIIGASTRAVRGTGDAWSFINAHPEVANKYSDVNTDIIPYFFPGGEAATAYYNWQKVTGRRRQLTSQELESQATNLVYQMSKSKISEEQAARNLDDFWYRDQIIALNKKFGGSAPALDVKIGSSQAKIAKVGQAIEDLAFQDSPIYEETKEFYNAYISEYNYLRKVRVTAEPSLSSSNWVIRESVDRLNTLANQLMLANPAFSRMYYGVFAGELKVSE
jgi:hypothetical protein